MKVDPRWKVRGWALKKRWTRRKRRKEKGRRQVREEGPHDGGNPS